MNARTSVFVYADDPVSQAGLEQLLRRRVELHVVGSGQIDEAQVAVIGTDIVSPSLGRFKWRRHKVVVKIGKPIDFSRYDGMGGNRFVERAVTDEVMYVLMRMSGPPEEPELSAICVSTRTSVICPSQVLDPSSRRAYPPRLRVRS